MSTKVIAGRKPLSSKRPPNVIAEPDFFSNKMALSSELISELAKKNLEYRFIDYKRYVSEGNQHSRGWKVYRVEKRETADAFILGDNPDGIIRRGSTVLAVRPIEFGDKHRAWLEQKRNIYKGFKKSKADELRQVAKESDSVVDDEFDEDDSE